MLSLDMGGIRKQHAALLPARWEGSPSSLRERCRIFYYKGEFCGAEPPQFRASNLKPRREMRISKSPALRNRLNAFHKDGVAVHLQFPTHFYLLARVLLGF